MTLCSLVVRYSTNISEKSDVSIFSALKADTVVYSDMFVFNTRLYGTTSEKTVIFKVTAIKSVNVTNSSFYIFMLD